MAEFSDSSCPVNNTNLMFLFCIDFIIDLETAHNIVMGKFNTRDKDRWTRIEEGEKE